MSKKPQSPARPPMTRLLSGVAKSRYLGTVAREMGADPALIAWLDAEIVQALVRDREGWRANSGRPRRQRRMAAAPKILTAPSPPLPPAPPAAFNPYAFSAMAVLMNEGRPALQDLLETITDHDQIAQLAQAQSVRLEPALLTNKKTSLTTLRTAFIAAVEKRIAHRKAVSG